MEHVSSVMNAARLPVVPDYSDSRNSIPILAKLFANCAQQESMAGVLHQLVMMNAMSVMKILQMIVCKIVLVNGVERRLLMIVEFALDLELNMKQIAIKIAMEIVLAQRY